MVRRTVAAAPSLCSLSYEHPGVHCDSYTAAHTNCTSTLTQDVSSPSCEVRMAGSRFAGVHDTVCDLDSVPCLLYGLSTSA